jgi:hypothetical protein
VGDGQGRAGTGRDGQGREIIFGGRAGRGEGKGEGKGETRAERRGGTTTAVVGSILIVSLIFTHIYRLIPVSGFLD